MGGPVGPEAVVAKQRLRAERLRARAELAPGERSAASAAIGERVLALPEIADARVVAAHVGVRSEPFTLPLLDALVARGVTVLLPALLDGGRLEWGAYDGPLVAAPAFGLREPAVRGRSLAEADVVVVPGVAFDRSGNRLGHGGGSYDRELAAVTVPVVGIAYDTDVVHEVPVEEHDRRVDVLVTPTRVLRFR